MKIYHYTTIKNLALILASKKIRFTRLDLLDDMQESGVFPDGFLSVAQTIFVSSWTKDSEENIPLWNMYATIEDGVRIAMPNYPFNYYPIKEFSESNHGIRGNRISPFTKDELFYNGEYMIINLFSPELHDFSKDVCYINNVEEFYKSSLKKEPDGYSFKHLWDFGKFKETKWSFQKESRFVLFTRPLLPLSHPLIKGNKMKQYDSISIQMAPSHSNIRYIDVHFSDMAFEEMEITTPPCISRSNNIIIESLIKNFNPKAKIIPSALKIRK